MPCRVLACLMAVLTIMRQPANCQLSSNYSELSSNYSQWNYSEGKHSFHWSCVRWYNHLEEALVANNEMIHQLQDTFFPISGHAPFSLLMQYDIWYLSNGNWEQKKLLQGWSISAVFSLMHPATIVHLQPFLGAIFWLQGKVDFKPNTITLYIVEDTGEFSPDSQLKCAIKKLTSWVSGG